MVSKCEIGTPMQLSFGTGGFKTPMLTTPPVPYDLHVGIPISHLLTMD